VDIDADARGDSYVLQLAENGKEDTETRTHLTPWSD
jgi:hypothetical protein